MLDRFNISEQDCILYFDKLYDTVVLQKDPKLVDFSWNQFADPKFKYTDQSLLDAVQSRDPDVDMYFKVFHNLVG